MNIPWTCSEEQIQVSFTLFPAWMVSDCSTAIAISVGEIQQRASEAHDGCATPNMNIFAVPNYILASEHAQSKGSFPITNGVFPLRASWIHVGNEHRALIQHPPQCIYTQRK